MNVANWAAVDAFFTRLLTSDDAALTGALAADAATGFLAHDVSATQGQLLALLIQITVRPAFWRLVRPVATARFA